MSSFTALGAFWRVVELDCGEVIGAVVEAAIAPANGLLCCRPALVALSHASFVFLGPLLPQATEINKWRSIGGWSRVRQRACRGAGGSSTPARLLLLYGTMFAEEIHGRGGDKVASSSF